MAVILISVCFPTNSRLIREWGEEAGGQGAADRCRYFTNVPEMEFLRWLTTQILVSDFPTKNEISLFEPRLSLCLRVPTHTQIKNLHL